ncbi:antitoxin [Nonomuraea basaltis]|uniref:antitoxin n=1 Tax=Nonomuraea basaltis TaxID=2495887 RepID=UPI00110C41B0|nr:antitoxin [Nonomuraea basaltis]TMR96316.1 antitoxin [Nonomuraea basaltis]
MSRMGEWLKKAQNLARGHSKQTDELLDKAERYAKERTGHKYDEQIDKGAEAVQRRYGGGQGATPGNEQRRPDQATPGPATPERDQSRRRPQR